MEVGVLVRILTCGEGRGSEFAGAMGGKAVGEPLVCEAGVF